ncbi:hypothetical protein Taro_055277 [Colocasia esculenta]|uniref:Stigma-specific STIG1-like protein 1 n=1 Tax=Colocasia esculenta TaxID=4460 RepID=A0A843XTS0_COLES|nr:hypothetical protein [Colocasia esculenta]
MKSTPQIVFLAALVLALLVFALAAAASPERDDNEARGDLETTGGNPRQSRFLQAALWNPWRPGTWCSRNPYMCRYPGSAGPDCCGARCVDRGSDSFNCGRCGHMCKYTEACCRGKCVDVTFNKHHCGRCFNKCKKGGPCAFRMCSYGF